MKYCDSKGRRLVQFYAGGKVRKKSDGGVINTIRNSKGDQTEGDAQRMLHELRNSMGSQTEGDAQRMLHELREGLKARGVKGDQNEGGTKREFETYERLRRARGGKIKPKAKKKKDKKLAFGGLPAPPMNPMEGRTTTGIVGRKPRGRRALPVAGAQPLAGMLGPIR